MQSKPWIFVAGMLTGIVMIKVLERPRYQGKARLVIHDARKFEALAIVAPEKLDALIAEARREQGYEPEIDT